MALPKHFGDFSMLHSTSHFTIASAAGLLALARRSASDDDPEATQQFIQDLHAITRSARR
jgi:hypothetical protein